MPAYRQRTIVRYDSFPMGLQYACDCGELMSVRHMLAMVLSVKQPDMA